LNRDSMKSEVVTLIYIIRKLSRIILHQCSHYKYIHLKTTFKTLKSLKS
jgi:hypothetical protein